MVGGLGPREERHKAGRFLPSQGAQVGADRNVKPLQAARSADDAMPPQPLGKMRLTLPTGRAELSRSP